MDDRVVAQPQRVERDASGPLTWAPAPDPEGDDPMSPQIADRQRVDSSVCLQSSIVEVRQSRRLSRRPVLPQLLGNLKETQPVLDQSKTELYEAAEAERQAAELIAHEFLTADLEQNLIPRNEAAQTVDEHREQNDETWMRAVYASLRGLRSARANGYILQKAA